MAKIDNKSAYLREVFTRVNLAGSEEERKQAMELMSDLSGYSLSEQEFTEFINGKKQIDGRYGEVYGQVVLGSYPWFHSSCRYW